MKLYVPMFVAGILMAAGASAQEQQTTPPVAAEVSAIAPTASYHYSAHYSARAKLALSDNACPCPQER